MSSVFSLPVTCHVLKSIHESTDKQDERVVPIPISGGEMGEGIRAFSSWYFGGDSVCFRAGAEWIKKQPGHRQVERRPFREYCTSSGPDGSERERERPA